MRGPLLHPGALAAFWVNLTDDARAPHPAILDLFTKYISRGDEDATAFLVYLLESNLTAHVSTEQRAIWVAERISTDETPTDTIKLHAA